jgi:transglutaminase-like putative cysteine protease
MSFDQALRFTSILLASASFIGLVLGASLPEWLTLLTMSALILALLRTAGFRAIHRIAIRVTLSTATWNILVLIGFLGFWIDSLWISGEFLPAGIHFLLILMVVKLFNLRLRRDYLHLFAISLVAILAAASLTADLWYFPIFLAYLLTGVWTLLLFQLTKKSEDAGASVTVVSSPQESSESYGRVTPQFFWMANGLAAATFGLTLVIFFTIPRGGAGFYQKGYGENIRTSGFSNTVDLGAIGPIKRDPSVVMRVELPDRPPNEIGRFYLRGVAFDRYDGRSWANQLGHRRIMSESTPGTFALHRSRSDPAPYLGPALLQNILLEPLDTPVLFAAPFAETVSGRFPAVQADLSGALYLPFAGSTRLEYSVVSRPNPVLPADLQPHLVSYPESFLGHFLQMPVQSERIAALARDVAHTKHTVYEKAAAIQDHLSRNYRYSLDAPLAEQANPLEEFLFNRKTGYCEHYATAMVIMLRTIGIPARLVTGFLATEWNEYGNYYVVRQQDAHAWVEVHLPYSGWVMMDPTPASGEGVGNAAPALQALGRFLDSFRLRWNRFFVQYSAADQAAVVRELQAGSASARDRAWDSLATFFNPLATVLRKAADHLNGNALSLLGEYLWLVVVVGLCALIWLGLKRPWKLRFFSKGVHREEPAIAHIYRGMIRHLAGKGILKPAATAPLEFIRITQEQWNEASSSVATITEFYCRDRFGRIPLTEEEFRSAQDNLRHLMALERP